jgi:hypothetical protein
MDKTPTTRKTPPDQSPKTADLQALYGANRDRTGDLLLAKQALSQLSYGPRRPILGRLWSLRSSRAQPMETLWKRGGQIRSVDSAGPGLYGLTLRDELP